MYLSKFVETALVEIAEGVRQAQLKVGAHSHQFVPGSDRFDKVAATTCVQFEVTVQEIKDGSKQGEIQVISAGTGVKGRLARSQSKNVGQRIAFEVPVAFATHAHTVEIELASEIMDDSHAKVLASRTEVEKLVDPLVHHSD